MESNKSHFYNMLLIPVVLLLLILGLYYSFVPNYVYYTTTKEVSHKENVWDVHLHFYSTNGFFALAPIGVTGDVDTYPDSFSNVCRYKGNEPLIFIKDAMNEDIRCQVPSDWTDASMTGTKIYVDFDGEIVSDNLMFPFEGDYEAFLIFPDGFYHYKNETTGGYDISEAETIPLGKVFHASSPESAILFKTNKIMTGLTLIVTGLTIFQIWNSMRGQEK